MNVSALFEQLHERELPFGEFAVLDFIIRGKGARVGEIGEFVRSTPSRGTKIYQEMKSRDWVEQKPDPKDGRANLVVATRTGKAVHRSILNKC